MSKLYVLNDATLVLQEVLQERLRQQEKWGEQNWTPALWLPILVEEVGEVGKAICEYECGPSTLWDSYRQELVQVAAVAVAMIESLDRNELREGR